MNTWQARQRISATLASLGLAVVLGACTSDADRSVDTAAGVVPPTTTADTARQPAPSADDMEDRVERALDTDTTLQRFGLDADDDDNRIVLKGKVRTESQRSLAMDVATREAAGLTVDNRIVVDSKAGGDTKPLDVDEVEDQVEDAIEADSTLRSLDIDVEEDNGGLVLEGKVSTAALKTAVETLAKRVAGGTVKVTNKLRVE